MFNHEKEWNDYATVPGPTTDQVLTNVYVDYQLLKTRGRVTYWSSSLISPFYSTNLYRDSILPTPMNSIWEYYRCF